MCFTTLNTELESILGDGSKEDQRRDRQRHKSNLPREQTRDDNANDNSARWLKDHDRRLGRQPIQQSDILRKISQQDARGPPLIIEPAQLLVQDGANERFSHIEGQIFTGDAHTDSLKRDDSACRNRDEDPLPDGGVSLLLEFLFGLVLAVVQDVLHAGTHPTDQRERAALRNCCH